MRRSSLTITSGSSPHVRGTLIAAKPGRQVPRFIPACAGNASDPLAVTVLLTGSSPHVRGTLSLASAIPGFHRFIPACAGNARPDRMAMLTMTVHPRMCGERLWSSPIFGDGDGSSPHVRGTLGIAGWLADECRFIPACAGNANHARNVIARRPVHPRMCGERNHLFHVSIHVHGSSPHVRGTLDMMDRCVLDIRFIPACAGNAAFAAASDSSSPVHPRMCGERLHR